MCLCLFQGNAIGRRIRKEGIYGMVPGVYNAQDRSRDLRNAVNKKRCYIWQIMAA